MPLTPIAIKIYSALITQTAEDPPTVIILRNNIGNIVWTRSSTGIYVGTLSGAFPQNKTFCTIGQDDIVQSCQKNLTRETDNNVYITTESEPDWTLIDGALAHTPIEIRIYL